MTPMPTSYTVVIPVLNQLHYTRQCVQSLVDGGTPVASLLVIDNGSSDETPAWLASQPALRSVRNAVNRGCGGAWTQGASLAADEWVVLLNNDVVVAADAMLAMLRAADRHGLEIVSPSLVEGELDYDLSARTAEHVAELQGEVRRGWFHGVAFAVRRRVFEAVGFPDTDLRLGGREDVEYLVRCERAGVPVGTVGDTLLHHFGSITQKAIKKETGARDLGDRAYFYRKLGMGWLERKRFKAGRKRMAEAWAAEEMAAHGIAMHMQRTEGRWVAVEYL